MLDTLDDALHFPKGNIDLRFCNHCCFIFNSLFREELIEYSSRYEDQQVYSTTFELFQESLVQHLVENYGLKNKTILEIGCGKGDFLKLICAMGNNHGIGIDPAIDPERFINEQHINIRLYPEKYSEIHKDLEPDFVCCRHTLEHIQNTMDFTRLVRNVLSKKADIKLFFEVPDTTRIINNCSFQDIYYEHCSYFLPFSLSYLFRNCGFAIEKMYRDFDDQYLLVIVSGDGNTPDKSSWMDKTKIINAIESFKNSVNKTVRNWEKIIKKFQDDNKNIVIWGSGSKCVAFLNVLNICTHNIEIVDINPYRHGKYLPGIDLVIQSPETIQMDSTDLVIVMNGIYLEEIRESIGKRASKAEIVALG